MFCVLFECDVFCRVWNDNVSPFIVTGDSATFERYFWDVFRSVFDQLELDPKSSNLTELTDIVYSMRRPSLRRWEIGGFYYSPEWWGYKVRWGSPYVSRSPSSVWSPPHSHHRPLFVLRRGIGEVGNVIRFS